MSSGKNKEKDSSRQSLPTISESPSVTAIVQDATSLPAAWPVISSLSASSSRNNSIDVPTHIVWSGTDQGWDLTWGIFHRLPREEQKKIATDHGLKSIGEFEEYVSLQQAVDDSYYSRNLVEEEDDDVGGGGRAVDGDTAIARATASITSNGANINDDNDDDDDDDEGGGDDDTDSTNTNTSRSSTTSSPLSTEELMVVGGRILILPSELLHKVFDWLPVDTYATLALVSPHWKYFTRNEVVYKKICQRVYLNQSKRRKLYVSRFNYSYRYMLEVRPRVRSGGGGCYVVTYTKVRTIAARDMWCEIPIGAILRTVYYRYLYFYEDGRCLYALSNHPPKIMFQKIFNVILHQQNNNHNSGGGTHTVTNNPTIVCGRFQIQKNKCSVIAKQSWSTVKFDITIVPDSKMYGKFAILTMDRHVASVSGVGISSFEDERWCYDLVEHQCPENQFRFIKDPRL